MQLPIYIVPTLFVFKHLNVLRLVSEEWQEKSDNVLNHIRKIRISINDKYIAEA